MNVTLFASKNNSNKYKVLIANAQVHLLPILRLACLLLVMTIYANATPSSNMICTTNMIEHNSLIFQSHSSMSCLCSFNQSTYRALLP